MGVLARDPTGVPPMLRQDGIGSRAPTPCGCVVKVVGGHVMWTLLVHAFYKHSSSTREVMLLSLRVAPWLRVSSTALRHIRELELLIVVACLAIVPVLCCLTHHALELHRLE